MTEAPDDGSRADHAPSPKDRRLVELAAAYGIPDEQVAKSLGMARATLRKLFDRELARGNLRANSKVAESLYQQAVGGNVTAQIWWSKARMGWTDAAHGGGGEGAERWPKLVIEIQDALGRVPVIAGQADQVLLQTASRGGAPR